MCVDVFFFGGIQLFKELTKFERLLWISSVITVTVAFIISKGNILSLIASIIGVTALIFVSKGYVFGQVLTVVFSVFYGIISFHFRYYGEMITYLFMTSPIAFMSVISWIKHPFKETKEVEINRMTKGQTLVMLVSAFFVTFIFYFILKGMGNANLMLSTVSITTSFLASYLTFMRSPYYALAYAANDIILIGLWVMASIKNITYLSMVLCFVMFFVNDMYGLINWKRMEIRQKKS